jgi:hypothetical protein
MSDFNHEEWRRNREATENIPSLTTRELKEYLRYFTRDELKHQLTFQTQDMRDACKERVELLRAEIRHRRSRKPSWTAIASLFIALAGLCLGIYNCSQPSSTQTEAQSTPTATPQLSPTPELRIGTSDLRKIIPSDVIYEENPFSGPLAVLHSNGGIKGRLRNELPRKIGHLELTILFFNSDGKLIETQPVAIDGDFYPGGPTSFLGIMPRSLNLPEGRTWKVTVSDAYYTSELSPTETPSQQ